MCKGHFTLSFKTFACLHWRKRNNLAWSCFVWKACLLDMCLLIYLGRDCFLCLGSNGISPGGSLMGLEGCEKISSSSFNLCPRKGIKRRTIWPPFAKALTYVTPQKVSYGMWTKSHSVLSYHYTKCSRSEAQDLWNQDFYFLEDTEWKQSREYLSILSVAFDREKIKMMNEMIWPAFISP